MDIQALSQQQQSYLTTVRRHLHQNPEVSGEEWETLEYIHSQLKQIGIPFVDVEQGGILAMIGENPNEKTVLLRGDIDALPMEESEFNSKSPKKCPVSKRPGVCHSCGHDAHTAMLLAAGRILWEHRSEWSGNVLLCFERGEECGDGIDYLLQYLEKHAIRVDVCHTVHVAPELPQGTLSAEGGTVMAGSFSFDITLTGAGGHGSRPDLANNPLDCFHAIYGALNGVRMRNIDFFDQLTFSIGKIIGGNQWNIIPEQLTFGGGARFFKRETAGMQFRKTFLNILNCYAELYGCDVQINRLHGPTLPVVNHEACAAMARSAYADCLGKQVLQKALPQVSSESMAIFQRLYPGVYCFLGTGNQECGMTDDVHSPRFDLDETVLPIGTAAHVSFALSFLQSDFHPTFQRYAGSAEALISMLMHGDAEETE